MSNSQSMTSEEKQELAKFYSRSANSTYHLAFKRFGKEGRNEKYFDCGIKNGSWDESYEECLHLTQVVVNAGGKIYMINSDGLTELEGEETYRGVSLYLQYGVEAGPNLEIHQQFHKGYIHKEITKLGYSQYVPLQNGEYAEHTTLEEGVPKQAIRDADIWRD